MPALRRTGVPHSAAGHRPIDVARLPGQALPVFAVRLPMDRQYRVRALAAGQDGALRAARRAPDVAEGAAASRADAAAVRLHATVLRMSTPFVTTVVIERLSRATRDAIGLPRDLYIDPAFHELERDTVLASTWYRVGLARDVPAPGDLLPYDLGGIPLLLARDRDGVVRAFHNVCSHRGVQLVSERRQVRHAIACPYHAWTYGLDGCLLRRPRFHGPGHCAAMPSTRLRSVCAACAASAGTSWCSSISTDAPLRSPSTYARSPSAGRIATSRSCVTAAACASNSAPTGSSSSRIAASATTCRACIRRSTVIRPSTALSRSSAKASIAGWEARATSLRSPAASRCPASRACGPSASRSPSTSRSFRT